MTMNKDKKLKITLIKSVIAAIPKHKECVKGLGLRRIRHSVLLEDTSSVRGMVEKIKHLLRIEEI